MKFLCQTCGKNFKDGAHLARHARRVRQCVPIDQLIKCRACNNAFSSTQSLGRHIRQSCRGAPLPNAEPKAQNVTVRNDIHHNTINTTNIQNNTYISVNTQRPIGWPAGWPLPSADLRPFVPPTFSVTLEQFQRAAAKFGECKESDSKAVADFMVEVLKQVQTNPLERNIYINPQRADQVIVRGKDARQWYLMSLQEGTRITFERIADELAECLDCMADRLQETTKTVESGFRKNTAAVVRNSRQAMAAHLTNLGSKLLSSAKDDGWLGNLDGLVANKPRDFGHELCGHMTAAYLIDIIERDLKIYTDRDVADANIGSLARGALALYAKLVLYRRPENLTMFLADNGGAFVHRITAGWERVAATDAARTQVRRLTDCLVPYLTNHGPPRLQRVGEYLRQHAAALEDEEAASLSLLTHYSREAIKFYEKGDDDVRVRARQAMLAAGLLAVDAPPALTDADVDALLAGTLL